MNAGRRIAAGRALRRQTQAQLALKLGQISGVPWSRNNVAAIENGQRAFRVDELKVFAEAQELPISWYIDEDGAQMGGYRILAALRGYSPTSCAFGDYIGPTHLPGYSEPVETFARHPSVKVA